MLSANAANASGTDRAPVVVAGGGGGTAGYNWIGSSSQAQGLNASIEVANNSDNGYWSNEATRNDSHAHVPYAQHSMVVNTVERSLMAKNLDRVILAIDSEETKSGPMQ